MIAASVALSNKARGIQQLQQLGFIVPDFVVISRAQPLPDISGWGDLILRSCHAGEDGFNRSLAGQSRSVGPISIDQLPERIADLFSDSRVIEIIVQRFVDAPTGVLFCLSPQSGILEYSRAKGAVTSGTGDPFVAIFPNEIARYDEIQTLIPRLYKDFGACDAEIALDRDCKLLQVRPITAPINYDERLLREKMALQELPFDSLIQDEFCTDLGESPQHDGALIEAYCKCRNTLIGELNLGVKPMAANDFIKLGHQIFLEQNKADQVLSGRSFFLLANWSTNYILKKWISKHPGESSVHEAMKSALALRTLAELNDHLPPLLQRLFRARITKNRIACRSSLLSKLEMRTLPVSAEISSALKSPLAKDNENYSWTAFERESGGGQIIVPGDFESGPFVSWTDNPSFPNEKVILTCDQLFPEIYPHFASIKGIICSHGALTSHLAILAREEKMPLWIQCLGKSM